jgi:DNA-binding LytR/AlgR family response regulator
VRALLQIVICDDQVEQRELQIGYLNSILKKNGVAYKIYTFESGEELLEHYIEGVDILFLDIQMGEMNGMETARAIRGFDEQVTIIFTTVVWDYVRVGYEVRAFRYLIKPLSFSEYEKEVNAFLEKKETERRYIGIKTGRKYSNIVITHIMYIEIENRKVYIHTKDEVIPYNKSIASLEVLLGEENFYRCHVGYIVGINWIKRLEAESAILSNGTAIPISRHRMKPLKKKLLSRLSRVIE